MTNIANTIPPPAEIKLSGDLAANWDTFKEDFQDYILACGMKDKEAQAATLRRVMGGECKHIYKHSLHLTVDQQKDVPTILDALGKYFKAANIFIFKRFVFGSLKQEDGEVIDV